MLNSAVARGILLFLTIACFALAFATLSFGNFFAAFIWFFVAILSGTMSAPVMVNMQDRNVPVLQIFVGLFLFIVIFSLAAFYDFRQAGIPLEQALVFGIIGGLAIVGVIMLLNYNN